MLNLNETEQLALNKIIEKSNIMGSTLTQEEMNYYNTNYDEQNADAARMSQISDKLRELMMIDVQNAELLRDVYTQEFNAVQEERETINAKANLTGIKKLFNYKERGKAREKVTNVLNKRELLAQRNEFDNMYNQVHDTACSEYDSYRNQVALGLSTADTLGLERMISALGYRDPEGETMDETARKNRKYEFLRSDSSAASKLKKLVTYSHLDRNYKKKASDYTAFYGAGISTDWVSRDIVGYSSKLGEVNESLAECDMHAKNLDKICKNKNSESEDVKNALISEMDYLLDQVEDFNAFKEEHQNLFGKQLPKGQDALKEYVLINNTIKKLQISKTATKEMYKSAAYKTLDKAKREQFENIAMRQIWAMHSYMSGLTVLGKRHYEAIMGLSSMEGDLFTWEENLKCAEKTDFKKEIK